VRLEKGSGPLPQSLFKVSLQRKPTEPAPGSGRQKGKDEAALDCGHGSRENDVILNLTVRTQPENPILIQNRSGGSSPGCKSKRSTYTNKSDVCAWEKRGILTKEISPCFTQHFDTQARARNGRKGGGRAHRGEPTQRRSRTPELQKNTFPASTVKTPSPLRKRLDAINSKGSEVGRTRRREMRHREPPPKNRCKSDTHPHKGSLSPR